MSTNVAGKRLTDLDVNTIFSCLSNNEQPPERLRFKVIRVPHEGLKLSPPSLELDDGIYVLLRSPKNQVARVPSGFTDKVLTDSDLASLARCPWSLSGPQYPKRKTQGVQQRYCYPRGNTDYSNDKGGAMWTTFDRKGSEKIETRILHVYYSNKRAGVAIKPACKSKASTQPRSQGVKSKDTGTKRKNNDVGQDTNKKNKVAEPMQPTETESLRNALECPSLLQGELLSPCQTAMSFELDSNLDFNSENLFDTSINGSSTSQSFSFMPVQSKDIDEVNATRDQKSTYNQYPATNGYYYGPYAYGRYPYPYGSWNAHYGGWARAAPSIPTLSQGNYVGVQEFSKRLKDLEDKLREEIQSSSVADQPLKLKLLQNWAKGIAQKPFQPKNRPTLEPHKAAASPTTSMSGTQAATSTHVNVKVKVETPGTPSITP